MGNNFEAAIQLLQVRERLKSSKALTLLQISARWPEVSAISICYSHK